MITDGIARVTPHGIVTADGIERAGRRHRARDGFHVTDSYTYVDIKGADGEDLVDRWNREGMAAHRGITVADVPNLFFLLGPNTGLGHNSVVFMIESQIRYVAAAIAAVDKAGAQALAPTRAAQDEFNDELQHDLATHRVEHRRLPQLVPRRARREPHAVVGLAPGSTGWRRARSSRPSTGSRRRCREPDWQSSTSDRTRRDTTCCVAGGCHTPVVVLRTQARHPSHVA